MKDINRLIVAIAAIVLTLELIMVVAIMLNRRAARWPSADAYVNPAATLSHVPASGVCRPGSTLVSGMFRQGGKEMPGCYNPQGDDTVDVIMPGESVVVRRRFDGR